MTSIEEMFSISTGYTFRGGLGKFGSGGVAIIQSPDIIAGLSDLIERLDFDVPRGSELQVRDILLTARGTFRAAVVDSDMLPAATLSSVLVLRPLNHTVNSDFVAAYLNSSHGQVALSKLITTGSVPSLRKVDLRDFKIPIPPPDQQNVIVELSKNIADQIRLHQKKMTKLQQLQNQVILESIGAIK